MMHVLTRGVRAFFLCAFSLWLVGAGAVDVVLCVGRDGHVAIEAEHDTGCRAPEHDSDHAQGTSEPDIHDSTGSGCVDVPLSFRTDALPRRSSPKSIHGKTLSASAQPMVAGFFPATKTAHLFRLNRAAARDPDPGLYACRTVILRI